MYNQNKGYESNKQEAKNLISMNPLSKHMSTPFNMGGSKSAMMMKGAMKGDQSKTRSDYAMDSGKTDKGYKGKTGSSKGDQSATKADYGSPAKKTGPGGPGKKSEMKKGGTKKSGKLKKANPKDYDTLKQLQKSGAIKKGKKGDSKRTFGDSPNKNLGMKYDIKEASNQSLSAKARKHYAENAQAASKSGYKG